MNFKPASLSGCSTLHWRSAGFSESWPTIAFWMIASLKWSTTAAIAKTPPTRS